MSVRLKRLELLGFKSFASRTVFDLGGGLTAVVGPNGSGKSNLSEAVRWALGEQSNVALRGRRGEDVIFAGSGSRAPLGMAEVTLTLDNASGGLPLDFSEVTIARRAFRDGETHYLINGSRVRLRDVLALTAPLGQSYTVIGQGLVDAALSARPEERRGLFEHAAGIAPLRLKRAEAERRLAEAEANRARLADLRAELEPRLRALERAAKHAREHAEARATLAGLQRRLFADLWRETRSALAAAEGDEAAARAAREAAGAEVARLTAAGEAARATLAERTAERRALAGREADLARRADALRRDLAVDEARLAATRRRLADAREAARALDERKAALARERERLAGEDAEAEAALAEARRAAADLERDLAEAEAGRATAARALREAAEAVGTQERERTATHRRRAAAEERRAALDRDRERAAAEHATARDRLAAAAAGIAALDEEACRAGEARATAEAAARDLRARLDAADAAEREAAAALAALERRVVELQTRLDGLRALAASGEGLYGGVRAVLSAARAGRLAGVVGTVAEILRVPSDLETAIEVALGGHLQDVVVERWADAESAIALLKERRAGRATFQPLDTIRVGAGREAPPAARPGVLGVAADLVAHEPRFATLARGLLGRVLVVEDLATTRAVLPRLGGGWSVVTRGGEIARASGAVTGGTAARESGLLARERTLRELPRALDALERERAAAAGALEERAAATRALRDELAARERDTRDAARAHDDARHRAAHQRQDHDALAAAVAAQGRRLAQLDRDDAALGADLAALRAQEEECAARLAALEAERAAAQDALDAADAAGATERPRLVALRADLARAEERRRGLHRERQALDAQEAALHREAGERADREAALGGEARDLEAALATRAADLAALEREQAALAARLEPLDAALAAGERDLAATGAALTAANEEALRRESALGAEAVEAARRRADRDALARRVADEMEDADPPAVLATFERDEAPPLPADERAALAGQVERLANRLRRLGAPSPEIVAEYEGEAERWRFLTEQLADVESALRSLRGVLAELDEAMAARFAATFARVAEEFRETFADLFGGGSARLVLVEPDGAGAGAGGVEIAAQPPGKKLQSLSLLSGGERALTAAALLFAILRVNPSPFCVLDEVDAALDESNVVRFRERLQRLSDRTQFVVITHNRGTIEGADTLYGITMGADGVSRALSLRLASDERVRMEPAR